jgi:hypothetical protein
MIVHPTREKVFAALFTKLTSMKLPTELQFVLTGRKVISWDAVPSGSQPAMFLKAAQQESRASVHGINSWVWHAQVWIYYRVDTSLEQDTYESKNIFTYLDTIESTLDNGNNAQNLNLNGVEHVWIDGQILFWEGQPDQKDSQAVIMVPISISLGT